ncbi:MAG: hypothetical protein ACTHNB_11300 [Gaiellaceae bacterium]
MPVYVVHSRRSRWPRQSTVEERTRQPMRRGPWPGHPIRIVD